MERKNTANIKMRWPREFDRDRERWRRRWREPLRDRLLLNEEKKHEAWIERYFQITTFHQYPFWPSTIAPKIQTNINTFLFCSVLYQKEKQTTNRLICWSDYKQFVIIIIKIHSNKTPEPTRIKIKSRWNERHFLIISFANRISRKNKTWRIACFFSYLDRRRPPPPPPPLR